jgi:3-hydroxyacyl-CoA dehydrogenase
MNLTPTKNPAAASADPVAPSLAMKRRIVFENAGAMLFDIGDGVGCFKHKTKMNIYDRNVFAAIGIALVETAKSFRALVIANDHPRAFSCGADLAFFLGRMKAGDCAALEAFLIDGQERFFALKYAAFPVVAAASGLALGGGCETLLHAHGIVANANLRAGMPEASLGILPGWGGCTQMIVRWRRREGVARGALASLVEPFSLILGSRVSSTALEALDFGALAPGDRIEANHDDVVVGAKAYAIELAEVGARPPPPETLFLPGPAGKATLMAIARARFELGRISANDLVIAEALATILTGGLTDELTPMTERQVMVLEREATISLAHRQATFERIEHMLATRSPLRN